MFEGMMLFWTKVIKVINHHRFGMCKCVCMLMLAILI